MADPMLPRKTAEGRLDDIRHCVACCNCWSDLAGRRVPIGCSVNARMGKEREYTLTPTETPKNIWVIGGGPGGMEAARIAAKRNHKVTLFDNRDRLGGQLLYADLPPHKGEWRSFITYQSGQLKKLGVKVELNKEIQVEDIQSGRPDAVIVATGARSLIPPIEGVYGPNVSTCVDVLTGRKTVGDEAVIIGAGAVGCETAEFLLERGKKVTLIEMQAEIAPDVDFWNRWILLDRLAKTDLRIMTETSAEEINSEGVRVKNQGQAEFIAADSVVLAVGARSYNALLNELRGKFENIHAIGDCVKPQKVRQAVDEGFRIGMTI